MAALRVMAGVVRGGVIHEVTLPIAEHERGPEILRIAGPVGFFGKGVTDMMPVDQICRPGDLNVDPTAISQSLGRIGVILAIGRPNHGRVGKILVEDRVAVCARDRRGYRVRRAPWLHSAATDVGCGCRRFRLSSILRNVASAWPTIWSML